MKLAFTIGFGVLALGCGSSPGTQVVTGQVAQATFPSAVDRITVTHAGKLVVQAPIAADGSFSIRIPPGQGYHLNLSSPGMRAGMINPRKTGTLGVTFAVRGNGQDFNVGTVRYIGDATTYGFKYRMTGGADSECEDGVDPTTNAVCVDDEGDGGSCAGADEADGETADDGAGGADDGETNDGPDDGETNDGEANDDNGDGVPDAAAVADRNLPEAMGCGDHPNEGDEQGDH